VKKGRRELPAALFSRLLSQLHFPGNPAQQFFLPGH
jgi:hypothetical protein